MHASSIPYEVTGSIETANPGTVFFPGDFLHLGSPEAIHTTFSRLTTADKLTRLAKGIYLKPKIDPELGVIKPSLEELAHKIADRDKATIRPTGSYALNVLGLSTQVPTKVVYLTNGNPKRIKIGKGQIVFKKAPPKQLAVQSEMVFLAIQALIELGERAKTEKVINQLTTLLSRESPKDILEGARLAPHRVARILYLILEKLKANQND